MAEPTDDDPPLGAPTPARAPRTPSGGAWYRRTPAVATAALALGLLVGIVVGRAAGDGDGVEDGAAEPAAQVGQTERSTTTTEVGASTTAVTLASECVETIRSAEQALGLLNQGLESLRQLDVSDLDEILGDMQRLRDGFGRRLEECLALSGDDGGEGRGGGTTTTGPGE